MSRKSGIPSRSRSLAPPRPPENPGLESSHTGDSHADAFDRAAGRRDRGAVCPARRRHGAAARSHSRVRRARGLEQRLPLVRRVARAGAWVSTWARRASAFAWRVRWKTCRGCCRRWRAASSRTPRFGRSPAWPRRRPRSGCSRSAAPGPPSTSSASSVAGAAWIGRPRPRKPSIATTDGRSMCIRMWTVRSSSGGGLRPRPARCSSRR